MYFGLGSSNKISVTFEIIKSIILLLLFFSQILDPIVSISVFIIKINFFDVDLFVNSSRDAYLK